MASNTNGHSIGGLDPAVADCFEALVAATRFSADDWRIRAAEANLDRNDTRAQECQAAVQTIREATSEVEALYQRWKDKWTAPAPVAAAVAPPECTPATKAPRSRLRVHVNSEVMECSTAAKTFARALERFGLERVAELGRASCGVALVDKSKATGPYPTQCRIGAYYVCTNINNRDKKRLLEDIAAELKIPIRVEITA